MRNVIYKITNLVSGKMYIGLSNNFKRRKSEHLAGLRHNNHRNPYLQNAFNKHGEEAFCFEVLEKNLSIEDLPIREKYWTNHFGKENLYNNEVSGIYNGEGAEKETTHVRVFQKSLDGLRELSRLTGESQVSIIDRLATEALDKVRKDSEERHISDR